MRAEDFRERRVEVGGWPVVISSYRLGAEYHAKADNSSPGAALARAGAPTREEAEDKVLRRAEQLLRRTKRAAV
jgi:hypothetical protein